MDRKMKLERRAEEEEVGGRDGTGPARGLDYSPDAAEVRSLSALSSRLESFHSVYDTMMSRSRLTSLHLLFLLRPRSWFLCCSQPWPGTDVVTGKRAYHRGHWAGFSFGWKMTRFQGMVMEKRLHEGL